MSELVFRAITEDGDTFRVNKTLPVWPMQYDEMEMWTWIFSYLGIRPFRGLGDADKYQLRNSYLGRDFAQAVDAMLVTNPEDFLTAARQALQHIPGAEKWANPEATLLIARDTFFSVVVPLFTDAETMAVVEQSVDHRTIGSSLTSFDRPNSVVLKLMERAAKEGAAFQTTTSEKLFDVSKYDVNAYNEDTEDEVFVLYDPDGEEPLYLARRRGCGPICEVTYSRLCDRIGLPCVRTVYGVNLAVPLPPSKPLSYIAVSSYNQNWMTFQDWLANGSTVAALTNADDYYGHQLLELLAYQFYVGQNDFAYVLEGGRYLKAGNRNAFSRLRVQDCFYGSYPTIQSSPMSVVKMKEEMERIDLPLSGARPTAEGLAALTDMDIAAIISMPKGPQTLWVREALRSEVTRIRALAGALLNEPG